MLLTLLMAAAAAMPQGNVDGTTSGAPTPGPGTPSTEGPRFGRSGGSTQQITLIAGDSKTMASVTSQNWNDNRFRAYWSSASQGFVDGFVKFDLSAIPDGSTITSMTLRAYHEEGFGNPKSDPEVRVYRVTDDSWSRAATNSHPGTAESLTGLITAFPTADLVPVDFVLDVNAVDWNADLADDALSLLLRNEAGNAARYSYVYFHGSDASPAPPELIVEYTSGNQLSMGDLIAGSLATIEINGVDAGATCWLGWSSSPGSKTVNTPWGSFTTDLGGPIKRLPSIVADASGYASLQVMVPPSAAGLTIHVQSLVVTGGSAALTNSVSDTIL